MTLHLAVDGDSHSAYIVTQGGRPDQAWHYQMAQELRIGGSDDVRVRSFALSGATSSGVLSRAHRVLLHETPDVAFLHVGVNDPGNSIAQATTHANLQALVKAWKFGCLGPAFLDENGHWRGTKTDGSYVAGQANLPADGQPGQRYVVMADTSTTGGVQETARADQHPLIPGAVAGQTVWEFRNQRAGEAGWARVATESTAPWHVKRIVVVSTPYRNITSGGDLPGTPWAQNVRVRQAQQDAVAAENVVVGGTPSVAYGDIYTMFRARIVAGLDPEVPTVAYSQAVSWHNQDNDQHLNPYGKRLTGMYLADLVRDTWPDIF